MASANDMVAAEKTYSGFITSVKLFTPMLFILAMIIVAVIAD